MRVVSPVGSHCGLGLPEPVDPAAVPARFAGLASFQVSACEDGAVGLRGKIDLNSQVAFDRALQRVRPAPDDSSLVFDMSAVGFIDHRALVALGAYAQKCQVPVIVRSPPLIARRLARVVGLEHLFADMGVM